MTNNYQANKKNNKTPEKVFLKTGGELTKLPK